MLEQYDKKMDDKATERLNCFYAKHYEPYSWCNLSDNICIEDTGNSIYDKDCENKLEELYPIIKEEK